MDTYLIRGIKLENSDSKLTKKEIIKLVSLSILIPFSFLIISWDFKWLEGWVVTIWYLAQTIAYLLFFYFKSPQLLKERMNRSNHLNQKKWDKLYLTGFSVLGFIWLLVVTLGHRFGWNHLCPYYISALGFLLLPISNCLVFNTIAENNFASTAVRIQSERNHHVVSTGVYSIVRHPMYIGTIISYIALPLILNSLWGLVIGLIISAMFVARIFGEEKMLEEGLEGYKEYEQKVKYRLIPHVW